MPPTDRGKSKNKRRPGASFLEKPPLLGARRTAKAFEARYSTRKTRRLKTIAVVQDVFPLKSAQVDVLIKTIRISAGGGLTVDENLRLNLSRPVPWLTSFSIDQGMLDEDHRRLIDMCNELCTAASFDVGRSERLLTDWGALELMNAHFTNEEWVLAEIEYPEAAGHKREHDRVRGSIVALSRAARERNFAQDLNGVRTELVEHIIRHDLGFKSHLLHRDGR